jgi:1,2-diacylglycerol 3-alpha-glucosyltransferase
MITAVLFHRIGPYHHARLTRLNDAMKIVALEFCRVDNTYAWAEITSEKNYLVRSIFDDDIDNMPANIVSKKINNSLTELNPKMVAIPGWSSPASIAALAWCCSFGIPAVLMSESTAYDVERIWWKEWIKKRLVRLFSAAFVGGGPHIDYVESLGMPRAQAFVGYDVVDNTYFSDHADKSRASIDLLRQQYNLPSRYFLASNRFIEKKNLERLLDAYAAYVVQAGAAPGIWCCWVMVL